MSKLAHSVAWCVLFLTTKGYYPQIEEHMTSDMGLVVARGLMYPEAHRIADEGNRLAKIPAPTYYEEPRDE